MSQVTATATKLVGTGKLIDPARVAQIWISPRKRAQHTFHLLFRTEKVESYVNGKSVLTDDLAEWDYGDYEGLVVDDIRTRRKEKGLDQDIPFSIWKHGCEGGEYGP